MINVGSVTTFNFKESLDESKNISKKEKSNTRPLYMSGQFQPRHHQPIAEFLFQLTNMLTDDNSKYLEWIDGRIEVHDPQGVADHVLSKYFRHSKYSSFQRQLNYFGFRKVAGKGKMSPCSYTNARTTMDLKSLLTIKRKASVSSRKRNTQEKVCSDEIQLNAKRSKEEAETSSFVVHDFLGNDNMPNFSSTQLVIPGSEGLVSDEDNISDGSENAHSLLKTSTEDSGCPRARYIRDNLPRTEDMEAAMSAILTEEDFFENRTYHEFTKNRENINYLSRNSSLIDLAMGMPSLT